MPFNVEIRGVREGEEIPKEYTCDGGNYSPEIHFENIPPGTKALALIVEDPDAPVGLFVHWVLYNIGPDVTAIKEKVEKSTKTKEGYIQGKNDFGRIGYDGPCPPKGHGYHRYFFKVYALNSMLSIQGSATRSSLLLAMEGKVLAQAEAMGRYKR